MQFSKAIQYLKEQGHDLFLECGPRSTLSSLARQQFTPALPCTAIPTLADTHENNTEWATLLFALGSLWQNGLSIDWDAFYVNEDRRRIPLPTYPFERQRFWVDPAQMTPAVQHPEIAFSTATRGATVEEEVGTGPQAQGGPENSLVSRKDRIAARLVELLVSVSGLDRAQISSFATFMELGFDSLSLTQVAFGVRREFSVKVSFSQLMNQMPNIEMLAGHLDAILPAELVRETPSIPEPLLIPHSPPAIAQGSTGESPAPAPPNEGAVISATAVTGLLSVESTVPQRGIYASSRLSGHLSASYNESMTLRFTGTISIDKMTRAMERLVERHDALRASFDESGLVMRIVPGLRLAMPVVDLSFIRDLREQEEHLRRLIAEETASPFPLPAGPLFRSQMVLFGSDRAALIFTAHHIICDGWSLDVLIHDLCAFYSEEISGTPASLDRAESYVGYVQAVNRRCAFCRILESGQLLAREIQGRFPRTGASDRSSPERPPRILCPSPRFPSSCRGNRRPPSPPSKTELWPLCRYSRLFGNSPGPYLGAASFCDRSSHRRTTCNRPTRTGWTLRKSRSLRRGATRNRICERIYPESAGRASCCPGKLACSP